MQNAFNRSADSTNYLTGTIFLRVPVFIGFIFFTNFILSPALAMSGKQAICSYDLLLGGDDVGDITATRMKGQNNTMSVQSSMAITVSGWFGSYNLSSSGEVLVDSTGIMQFDHTITEEGKTYHLVGERRNKELWCSAREVLSRQEQEDAAVVDIAASTAVSMIPYAGEALGIVSLFGEVTEGQGELRIPGNLFDTSATMLENYLLKNTEKMHNRTVRILDSTELSIETIRVDNAGQEQVAAAGQSFRCHVFRITTSEGQSTSWVAEDSMGAFLVKESGKDEDGAYEIRLKKYTISETAE
jgi:hypothetical protein